MPQPDLELDRRLQMSVEEGLAASTRVAAAASSRRVNLTHRLVRERALTLRARRSLLRSLWVPLVVCSGLVLLLCSAVWSVLDQSNVDPTGVPDSSQQIFVLMMWCLPLSAILLGVVLFRRAGNRPEKERRS